jgi:hypothetical protein
MSTCSLFGFRSRAARGAAALLLLLFGWTFATPAVAETAAPSEVAPPSDGAAASDGAAPSDAAMADPDEPDMSEVDIARRRLTERVDKRRPDPPLTLSFGGRPLIVSGQIELHGSYDRQLEFEDDSRVDDLVRTETDVEVELFYSFRPDLHVFAEGEFSSERDVHQNNERNESDSYVERGESWLFAEDVADSGWSFEAGRLNFEDERRWWWDEELDAIRLSYPTETFNLAFAVAQELLPSRSDQSYIDPEQEDVFRMFGKVAWNYAPEHTASLFALYQRDSSSRDRVGDEVDEEREDPSDGHLTWLGLRLTGAWSLGSLGLLQYWTDGGMVRGYEYVSEFEEASKGESVVEETGRRSVSGWGLDLGATWTLPTLGEPRLSLGYAIGSGDDEVEDGSDRSFRQTGIHENEAGFGGAQRFLSYGELLAPELSNLQILTAGVGLSLFESSSIDLVYHYYRQMDAATFLRNAEIDGELTGRDRSIGQGLDLVLAVEEWERFEFEIVGSMFRAGSAFGDQSGDLTYGGFAEVRFLF